MSLLLGSDIMTIVLNAGKTVKYKSTMAQFFLGATTELLGGLDVSQCTPDEWKVQDVSDDNSVENKEFSGTMVSNSSVWEKVIGALGVSSINLNSQSL